MATIRRRSYSGSSDKEADKKLEHLSLGREIYRRLSNLTDNKTIVREKELKKYNRWIDEFDDISIGVSSHTVDTLAADEYLGSLGVGEVYPFVEDTYHVDSWIELAQLDPFRNVATMNNKILKYNVVYNDGTTTFNVVHNTGA